MAARETWTDERLDDLNRKVDEGFREMREEFRRVDNRIDGVREEMKAGFDRVNDQMLAQQRMMLQLGGGMFATMIVGFLGVIATILTQT